MREDGARGGGFDDLARIHDVDVLGVAGDKAEVVRDEERRHLPLVRDAADEVEDIALRRDIERRRRLVGDEKLRLLGERHGDHHALLLAAGKFARIAVRDVRA